jgi:hemin uptake protein HemP
MSTTVALSVLGLAYTIMSPSFKAQNLEGPKKCDFASIQVLQKGENKIYMKHNGRVFVMERVPTAEGVKNVKRFETRDHELAYLQLPEKAMLLNNKEMKPVLNDCLDI